MSAGTLRVAALVGLTCLPASALTWTLRDAPSIGVVSVAWFAIAAGYLLTELVLVHFECRSEAHSMSFSGVPLVIGLYALSPLALITARIAGSAVALIGIRRQAPIKVLANLSSFWLADTVAVLVFRWLLPQETLGIASWPAAFLAAVVADQLQGLLVTMDISLFQGRLELLADPMVLGLAATIVNSALAIVGLTLLMSEPAALGLLGLALPVLHFSYRVHSKLREKHRHLEQLYEFTREISASVLSGRVVATLLDQVRELMHAESAWLCVADEGGGVVRVETGDDGTADPMTMPAGGVDDLLHRRAHAAGTPVLLSRRDDEELRPGLHVLGVDQVMVAPLRHVGSTPAAIVVADRSGNVRDFEPEDVRLFATLVGHAETTLENDHLLEELRRQAAASEYQSLHDALTGLPNRTLFGKRLTAALQTGAPLAVLLLDLNRFKEVNDTLGHHHGDVLLQSVAHRLRDAVRTGDTVARFGGDEFAVLLPDIASLEAAEHVAGMLLDALNAPMRVADLSVTVDASIGIALAPSQGRDPATLLSRADIAMYTAKADRTGVERYRPDRDLNTTDRLLLAGHVREAIERGTLAVHFQPQLDLASGSVIGAEALVRWAGDSAVQISPAELVAIAENMGMTRQLTMHVLRLAVAECQRWWSCGWEMRVSVNLSAHDLLDSGLVADVVDVLDAANLPTRALCLELTETSVLADPVRTVAILGDLHDAGVEIAVDDFGTGYSSLTYLTQLPVDEVKIDRSFVLGMNTAESDEVIVRSVVDLGRNLGLRVVAEGIETDAASERLAGLGCDAGQGYLYSRPLTAKDFLAWMTSANAAGTARRSGRELAETTPDRALYEPVVFDEPVAAAH